MKLFSLKNIQLCLIFCISLSLSSCGNFNSKQPNPELASTIIRTAAKYLVYVVNADENEINGAILWTDILKTKEMNKPQYRSQMSALKKRFPGTKGHPLIGLNIKDLEWTGDEATVSFVNASGTPKDTIWVQIMWSGSGWLVDDDSLFGKDKQIERWTAKKIAPKES